jgi:hypothetical protein
MLIAATLGLIVGGILALTGAGGGILAVPLLVFGSHVLVAEAAPIALLAVGMAAALGAGLGLKARIVRYRSALLVAAMGVLLSPIGLWLAHRTHNRWLTVVFAVVLLYVAWTTFRRARGGFPEGDSELARREPCIRDSATGRFVWTWRRARALALSGSATGVLSGLLGVGGGFVLVPALQRYTDLEMRSTVATSLAVIALISTSAVIAAIVAGALRWNIAIPFTAGALAGMIGGRGAAARIAGPKLQVAFAVTSALVALAMIVKGLFF